jgi:hypothetical protein
MPHTSTTIPFADKQVVPMFILSPKVIQRFVRRQTRHPCCIHRMTNEGQTGEQNLNNFAIPAPLPPLRWGKTASAAAAAQHISSGGPVSSGPAASWSDGQKHFPLSPPMRRQLRQHEIRPRSRFGSRLNRAIGLADPAARLITTALNRFPDASHTVDSDNEGQDRRNAKGLRIGRGYTPFETKICRAPPRPLGPAGW